MNWGIRNWSSITALSLVALSTSGCFQQFAVRQPGGNSVVGGGSSNLNGGLPIPTPTSSELAFLPAMNFATGVPYQGNTFLPAQTTAQAASYPPPPADLPTREVQGSVCRFKVRSLQNSNNVLMSLDLTNFVSFKEDIINTLNNTTSVDGDNFKRDWNGFSKLTPYRQSAWGYAESYTNPVFAAGIFWGPKWREEAPSVGHYTDFGLPDFTGTPGFLMEVQGGDAVSCGFDISVPSMATVDEVVGGASRSRARFIGPMMINEKGDLLQPSCVGGTTGGTCQAGNAKQVGSALPLYYTVSRSGGKLRNWFYVNITNADLAKMSIRVWGFHNGFTGFNSGNYSSSNFDAMQTGCKSLPYSESEKGGPNTEFPMGQTLKQMCVYANFFWGLHHN